METYELLALYFLKKASAPKAVHKPVLIFIGDEKPYPTIDYNQAKECLDIDLGQDLKTAALFKDLAEAYSIYHIHKPYEGSDGDRMSAIDKEMAKTWAGLIGGNERIAFLHDPDRVVDVIFGLLAQETDRVEYFREEIEERQKPAQVQTVYKALNTVHRLSPPGKPGKPLLGRSVTKGLEKGKTVKGLLE
jgi:hypothetical protein